MTDQKAISSDILLTEVRIAFPNIFQPRAVEDKGEPRYSATLIMDPKSPSANKLREVIKRVAMEKWGDKAGAVLKALAAQDRLCLRDGATKADYDGFDGKVYTSASSKVRPLVIHRDRTPLTEQDGVIYAGCIVNAKINVWAQDNQYGKRINAQLMGVQFVRDDEAFSGAGRVAKADEFDMLENEDVGDLIGGGDDIQF